MKIAIIAAAVALPTVLKEKHKKLIFREAP